MSTEFSNLLHTHLAKSSLSDRQVAFRIGVSPTTLSRWITGQTHPRRSSQEAIEGLSVLLGLSEEESQALLDAAFANRLAPVTKGKSPSDIQLPHPYMGPPLPSLFVGREHEIQRLIELLTNRGLATRAARSINICGLCGLGGIGKSSLATVVAYQLFEDGAFPDGVFWTRADMVDPIAQLNVWINALGGDPSLSGDDLFAKGNQWRVLLQSRRALIVLDNAIAGVDLDLFIPTTGNCAVLVTSRNQYLPELHSKLVMTLGPLVRNEALQLFEDSLGVQRVQDEVEDAHALAALLGDHPLALALAARRLMVDAHDTFSELHQRLESHSVQILNEDVPRDKRDSLQLCFEESYRALDAKTQQFFASLGGWDGHTFSTQVAEALAALSDTEARRCLSMLFNLSLVQREMERGWYSLHPMVKEFAAEVLQRRGEAREVSKRLRAFWQTSREQPATLLALQLTSYSQSTFMSPKTWQEIQLRAQDAVVRYQGVIIDQQLNNHDNRWCILFGAQQSPQGQAAEAAVRCAISLRTLSHSYNISLSAGLVTMETSAIQSKDVPAPIITAQLQAYEISMFAGKGNVVCDESTYRIAQHHFTFKSLGPMNGSAQNGATEVFLVNGFASLAETRLTTTQLIGRSDELTTLQAYLNEVSVGQTCIVALSGSAGIGKSSLVTAFMHLAEQEGFATYQGASQSMDSENAYTPWAMVLSQFFNLSSISGPSKTIDQFEHTIGKLDPDWEAQLPLLNDLLPLNLPETDFTRNLSTRQRHETRAVLLSRLFHVKAKKQPLLLLFEDVHWLDSASWTLLLDLTRQLTIKNSPVLFALIHRPFASGTFPPQLDAICNLPSYQQFELTALSASSVHELARHLLGVPYLPSELIDWLNDNVPGIPLYVREALNQLIDREILQPSGPAYQLVGELGGVNPPEHLKSLILSRFDRLDAQTQLAAYVAAIIGQYFDLAMLSAVYPLQITTDDLSNQVEVLQGANFLSWKSTGQDDITFAHAAYQEAIYDVIPSAQRADLHERVGKYLEAQTVADSLNWYGQLVYHYERSANVARALNYAHQAGELAAARYASAEAIKYLNKALAWTIERDFSLEWKIASTLDTVYEWHGGLEEQRSNLEYLERLAELSGQAIHKAEVFTRWADYYEHCGQDQQLLHAAMQGVYWAHQAESVDKEAEARSRLGNAYLRLVQCSKAATEYEQALELHRKANNYVGVAWSLLNLGRVSLTENDFDIAQSYFEKAYTQLQQVEDQPALAWCLNCLGNIALFHGEYSTAQRYYRQATALWNLTGSPFGYAGGLNNLGHIACLLGKFEAAIELYEQSVSIWKAVGEEGGTAMSIGELGSVYTAMGEYETGKRYLEEAIAIRRKQNSRRDILHTLTLLAINYEWLGDWTRARANHDESLRVRLEIGQLAQAIENRAGLARIAIQQGNLRIAQQNAQICLDWLDNEGEAGIENCVQVYHTIAQVWSRLGHSAQAEEILNRAGQLLADRANKITDTAMRYSYLNKVTLHRKLVDAGYVNLPA